MGDNKWRAQVVIDFGLSVNSTLPEEKGVDLYVMERAMGSAHSEHKGLVSGNNCVLQASLRLSLTLSGW